jgi:hypothetical protein
MEATGLTGIYWDLDRVAFRAWIYHRLGSIYVGDFETLEEAQRARDRMKRIYSGGIPPRPKNRYEQR